MSIGSRTGLQKSRKGKIGPISAPQNGRPLNVDTLREGGPISLSAIGRQDIQVDTAPEAAKRREERRHEVDALTLNAEKEEYEGGEGDREDTSEETLEEKINEGHEAWREGDSIIVEDEEGEVIRTISSPKQHESSLARSKFGKEVINRKRQMEEKAEEEPESITGRLKRIWSGRGDSSKNSRKGSIDLERGVPEDEEEEVIGGKQGSARDSSRATRTSPKPVSAPRLVVDEDNRMTSHVTDRTERRAREEREKETDVERRRREAVLGLTQDSEDDEEAEGPPHPSRNKGKAREISSDDDQDEDSPEEAVSSRSHSSAGGAESSNSGNQLLAPPAPARTRGIRFGDISVGQESFSLEEGPPSSGARHHKTGSGDWRVRWRSDNK